MDMLAVQVELKHQSFWFWQLLLMEEIPDHLSICFVLLQFC